MPLCGSSVALVCNKKKELTRVTQRMDRVTQRFYFLGIIARSRITTDAQAIPKAAGI